PGVLVALVLLLLSGPTSVVGIFLLIATSLILWIGLVFVGFAIGATTKNARRANSIPQVLSIAMGFLPPVYYPLARLDAYPIAKAFAMAIAALPPGAGWLYWYAATYRSPAYSRRMRTPKVPKCRVLSPIPPIAIAAAAETRRQPNAIHRYGPDTSVFRSSVTWMPV